MEDSKPKKLNIKKINHVGIPISDRRHSLMFFRDILGLEITPSMVDSTNIVWMKTQDGSMVHLIEPTSARGVVSGWHVALEVEDFDETINMLRERGIKFTDGPGERHDGQRFIFLTDPDGNKIEITSRSNIKKTNRVADDLGKTTQLKNKPQ